MFSSKYEKRNTGLQEKEPAGVGAQFLVVLEGEVPPLTLTSGKFFGSKCVKLKTGLRKGTQFREREGSAVASPTRQIPPHCKTCRPLEPRAAGQHGRGLITGVCRKVLRDQGIK